ncbi:alkaline shock response membrane anchor protein AmaP [Candidatus Enterococcus mansonii]|uniref:Alkaline shock response membrane anchor protein AmaP n=1 Tax=Candidatus Enterococcus mansonii TaxID=1834181 RepID=A0A242C5J3_9ENTE|nr:alkaline shock response membrane anchor protein AmaP [Enterococcus sp. 4G2_DIV0659]OTO05461.1 hypothetical protein A5880_002634 [Enterococcus sp. 4G2_DIV0659]
MKRFLKVIFILILLLLFIGTLGLLSELIEIPWLSQEVQWLLYHYSWMFLFFKGILLVLGGCLVMGLVIVLSVSGKRKRLVIKEEGNRIEIPKSTVEAVVKEAYTTMIHPDKTKMTVKIKGKQKVIVRLQIDVRSQERYQLLAEEIKQEIQKALLRSLETIDSQVIVHLREKQPTESSTFSKKQSRVV